MLECRIASEGAAATGRRSHKYFTKSSPTGDHDDDMVALARPTTALKRANGDTTPTVKRTKLDGASAANPLAIKPLGNLLLSSTPSCRPSGLGALSVLGDELLLQIFGELSPRELHLAQGVSRAFFAWCAGLDSLWKAGYIAEANGFLGDRWAGSWRETYLRQFVFGDAAETSRALPSRGIECRDMYSDVLFQPILCATFDLATLARRITPNIPRLDARESSLPRHPVILTHATDDWSVGDLATLATRFPETLFRAEATLTTLGGYSKYHDACQGDESPLYLFESDFVEKTASGRGPGLGAGYAVPAPFREDLFSVMGDRRPDYRWLIVGPARSGSTWHQDPNGTSAWNACITGSKLWICFPPSVTPPGVHISDDGGEVESPLSIAEWLLSYYQEAKERYGPRAKDVETRGKLWEGICGPGEVFFVPSGWWHLVVNLSSSVAITQNFVSSAELAPVLDFMKHRPSHVSGFRLARDPAKAESGLDEDCETGADVFSFFVDSLRRERPDVLEQGLKGLEELEAAREPVPPPAVDGAAFSFGFAFD